MNFDVCGGFEIARKPNRHGVFDKAFWDQVRMYDASLPDACGCYIFAMKNGSNIVAWYVGKTEKNRFQNECFQATKINYYNDVLASRNGTPLLFFLPRKTGSGKQFSKPTKVGYRDIEFLETMLIGIALERNSALMNVKKTKLLREMHVPGIINSSIGHPSTAVADLRNALGVSGS
jgi:hypothetical protein